MLDAYIIDDIKKREDERRRREDLNRPRLHIEIDDPRRDYPERHGDESEDPDNDDGVVRIDLYHARELQ